MASDPYLVVNILRRLDLATELSDPVKCHQTLLELEECVEETDLGDSSEELLPLIDEAIDELEVNRSVEEKTLHERNEAMLSDVIHRTANHYLRHSSINRESETHSVDLSRLHQTDDVEKEIQELVKNTDAIESEALLWTMLAEDLAEQNRAAAAAFLEIHQKTTEVGDTMSRTADRLRESREKLMETTAEINQKKQELSDRLGESSTPDPEPTIDDAVGVADGVVEDAYSDGRAAIRTDLANDGVFYLSSVVTDLSAGDEVEIYYECEQPGAGDIIRVLNPEAE